MDRGQNFTVSDASRMGSILKSLERNRTMLGVNFRGSSEFANTMVVGVDTAGRTVLLDEFNTNTANDMAMRGSIFSVRGNDQGVDIFFSNVRAIKVAKIEGNKAYRVAFPESMSYKQRRDGYRVQIGEMMNLMVEAMFTFEDEDEDGEFFDRTVTLDCELSDLSVSGCRVTTFKVKEVPLPDAVPVTCKLRWIVPDTEQSLVVEGVMRHFVHNEHREVLQIGVEFIELEQRIQDEVDRFVIQAQFIARREAAER